MLIDLLSVIKRSLTIENFNSSVIEAAQSPTRRDAEHIFLLEELVSRLGACEGKERCLRPFREGSKITDSLFSFGERHKIPWRILGKDS